MLERIPLRVLVAVAMITAFELGLLVVRSIGCSPFPLGVPHESGRKLLSIPRHVERSVQIPRTPLSCSNFGRKDIHVR